MEHEDIFGVCSPKQKGRVVKSIKFNESMALALLSGHKTQTRRMNDKYKVGDILWVKEPWAYMGYMCSYPEERYEMKIEYIADKTKKNIAFESRDKLLNALPKQNVPKYTGTIGEIENKRAEYIQQWWLWQQNKPASTMPKWASRMTIEITGKKQERLQDITKNDARAEGVDFLYRNLHGTDGMSAREKFFMTWEYIYGARSCKNPIVTAYTFRRID